HCRTIQRVAAYIAVGKRKGRRERRRIEPFFGGVRSGSVNRLPRIVGTNWVFTENSPRISRISKNRNRKWHPRLILINRGEVPVLRDELCPLRPAVRRNVVHAADCKAMPHITPGTFFRRQVTVVLRNRRLIHRRAKIRRVGQILRKCVIRKKTQSV